MDIIPQCLMCKHFKRRLDSGHHECEAFKVIPDEIEFNEVDHREPVRGDHGIQFEAKEGRKHPLENVTEQSRTRGLRKTIR